MTTQIHQELMERELKYIFGSQYNADMWKRCVLINQYRGTPYYDYLMVELGMMAQCQRMDYDAHRTLLALNVLIDDQTTRHFRMLTDIQKDRPVDSAKYRHIKFKSRFKDVLRYIPDEVKNQSWHDLNVAGRRLFLAMCTSYDKKVDGLY